MGLHDSLAMCDSAILTLHLYFYPKPHESCLTGLSRRQFLDISTLVISKYYCLEMLILAGNNYFLLAGRHEGRMVPRQSVLYSEGDRSCGSCVPLDWLSSS